MIESIAKIVVSAAVAPSYATTRKLIRVELISWSGRILGSTKLSIVRWQKARVGFATCGIQIEIVGTLPVYGFEPGDRDPRLANIDAFEDKVEDKVCMVS